MTNIATITVTRLADLRVGDVITSMGGRALPAPRCVSATLGPIEDGSPVHGVRLVNPDPASTLELVYYPSQVDGIPLVVVRGV
ncbi:hypothetical protein ACMT9Y_15360 [Clavibacter tessellarius]|uniref:hypothetical protein n=1 Tax=Clavibacter tessellarius TaxID=31965 RepID=UPI0039E86E95